ncbi:hypothetical protein JOC34_000380 [Virgibacillus halotolerans]|uniref:hypothetical protein n=1 Tax=Virgibacillus halotolerans TaxID=1071053 RepID=UPI00195FAC84|nr:hypothetical protein [Virgibacillus halotolerans]MBM7598023.1 hypothetical protein [Virgibacillus halotolerans]
MENQIKINVVDSIMGSGKTSWAIQRMNKGNPLDKYIYITPYLDEVKRIIANTDRDFFEPNNNNKDGSKMYSLKQLIVDGKDIVSTHSLFQTADDELIELLDGAGYTLILDEVMDVIERANVTQRDISDLKRLGHIEVEYNRVIRLCDDYDVQAAYSSVMRLAKAGNLFYFRGRYLIWAFPPRVFNAFSDVYVMTYLFDAQIQRYYFDLYNFEYKYHAVNHDGDRYNLVEYDKQGENREELMALINLYEGKLNDVGSLSATYLRNLTADKEDEIRKNIYNYFRNVVKAKSKEIIWTTVKDAKTGLSGKGYARSFLQCNARATNEYQDRWALAYVFNRFMTPTEISFFQDNGVTVNEELLAVADLLQWIYRSRIRNGKQVELYLPSERMRTVLKAWANYKI